jgi:hypothetical protein
VRLLDTLYFSAGLHRVGARNQLRPQTPRDRAYAQYGPSRVGCLVVVLLWLLVLVLVLVLFVRLAVLLHGPTVG